MIYRLLADAVVLAHLCFIVFVVSGGFLAWRWPKLAWFHAPAALWGAAIEFAGWICPLTPLENKLRSLAGGVGYQSGFIEHYLVPIIYPAQLTTELMVFFGLIVIFLNAFAYSVYFRRRRNR